MTDPITEAISTIITEVMRQGVSIQPAGEGWVVRLASEDTETQGQTADSEAFYLRSW